MISGWRVCSYDVVSLSYQGQGPGQENVRFLAEQESRFEGE